MSSVKPNIIVFGGTFDPPHKGHIGPVQEIKKIKNSSFVVYVPVGRPPHKSKILDAPLRLELLRSSLEGISDTIIDEFEIHKTTICYSYETLEYLYERYKGYELLLTVGSDQAKKFSRWKNVSRILEIAKPVCMVRDECYDIPNWHFDIINVADYHISSTMLREKLKQCLYDDPIVQKWIFPQTLDLIKRQKVYEHQSSTSIR